MPNTLSAKKRHRQNVAQRDRNRTVKSAVRTSIRNVRQAIAAGDLAGSQAAFQAATKRLDQAAAKGVFHANKVARTKSRLSKTIQKLEE